MYGNKFRIDANNNVILYNDDDEKLTIIQAAQQQINAMYPCWMQY